ncbi:MAG: IclR family transcriptional regulator [Planctomycetia bacterium]|nr:IclR family transcriptional regulator [Planctomycetia bacterium]
MSNSNDENTHNYIVPNLDRALSVLETLSRYPKGLGVTSLAKIIGIPKNSAFRILYTLEKRGYVEQSSQRKLYRLTYKILTLAHSAFGETPILERALPILHSLRNKTRETVMLGVRNGDVGVVLEQIPALEPIKFSVSVGYQFQLYTAAPGKVFLAWLPNDIRDDLLSRISFQKLTATTITSQTAFLAELRQVREQGFALDRGEEVADLRCVAAPIFDYRNQLVAAVWVNAPAFRASDRFLDNVSGLVVKAAKNISDRLGSGYLSDTAED